MKLAKRMFRAYQPTTALARRTPYDLTPFSSDRDTLSEFSPFGSLFNTMNQLSSFADSSLSNKADVIETDSNYAIKVDVPGIQKENIKINMQNNVITIKGERKDENEKDQGTWHVSERSYGAFTRSKLLML
jgi:HSP20 family molecular chaperone IbpA